MVKSKKRIVKKQLILGMCLCLNAWAMLAQTAQDEAKKGNESYRQKDYVKAEVKYKKSQQAGYSDNKVNYNLGNALYQQKKFEEAESQYHKFIDQETNDEKKSDAYYNLGNTYFQKKDMDNAMAAYKLALLHNPENENALHNFLVAEAAKRKPKKKPQNDKEDKDKKQKKDQQGGGGKKPNPVQPSKLEDTKKVPQPQKLDSEVKEMLKNIGKNEAKIMQKIMKKKVQAQENKTRRPEKDW